MDDTTKEILKELEEYQKTGQYKKPGQDKKPEKKAKEAKKEKKMEDAPEGKEVVIRFRMPRMPSPRAIERAIYILIIVALLFFAFVKPINKECISMPGFSKFNFFGFFGKGANATTEAAAEEAAEEVEESVAVNKTVNETKKIEPVRQSIANLNSTSNLTASDFDFAVGDFIIDKKTNETVKIRDIKFTIRNKGTNSFTGFVEAYMYDEATKEDMEDYKRGEKLVAVNAGTSATYSVAISPSIFRNLGQEKTIVLLLKDSKHELIKKATKKISFD